MAACSWQTADGWTGRRFLLGSNKEVFDAELFAIHQAMRVLEARDSQARFLIGCDGRSALPHLTRRATERRTVATSQRVRDYV